MTNPETELVQKIERLLIDRYGNASTDSLRRAFDAYDSDRDGGIGAKELERLLKDAGVGNALTRGAWVKGILNRLDVSRDGEIDWTEFTKAIGG